MLTSYYITNLTFDIIQTQSNKTKKNGSKKNNNGHIDESLIILPGEKRKRQSVTKSDTTQVSIC